MRVIEVLKAVWQAMVVPTPYWARPIVEEAEVDARAHIRCGVPDCEDGRVTFDDGRTAIVDCDPHNAFTTHDVVPPEKKPQQIIRVQDQWRQHGVTRPPR